MYIFNFSHPLTITLIFIEIIIVISLTDIIKSINYKYDKV
jgi:hypothetical protein